MIGLSTLRLALVAAFTIVATVRANPYETTLDNGLKVIVREDRRAPSVVHMLWYRVGAMDEPDGISGIAHMLEHMMFKGTEKFAPGEMNRRVAAVGGRQNAFTSRDYTAYYQQVPPDRLGEMMMLEADRMLNLKIASEQFSPELEVVKEERRLRTDDSPRALLYEQLMATAFQAHPYRRPVIGWMSDIAAYAPADARTFYDSWYAPNNACLVVIGDVCHAAVIALAQTHYGPLPARPLPERRPSAEPPPLGPRETTVRVPAELPALLLAWPTPTLRNPQTDHEVYALQVLAAALDGHDGARLPRRLVREEKMAVSVGAGYRSIARGPSLFILSAVPSADRTVAELETALRAEIARIGADGITEDELRRVKTRTVAAQVFKRDSLQGQAMEIGMLDNVGLSWRDDEAMLAGIRQVTVAQVQAVAQKYFADTTMTRAILDPLPSVSPSANPSPLSPSLPETPHG